MSFRDYLKSLKYLASKSVKLNFVLGNSSVDFDSFFGSLIYSYYLNHFSTPEETYLPLIDCPEEDIKLRFEIYKILKDTNSQPSDLLYYKNYLKSPQQIKKHKFILYDHNSRPQIPSQNIDHIVDHHFFQKLPVKRFLIHKVGSLLTLLYYIYNPHKLAEVEKNIFLIEQMETKEESLISQTMRQFLNCQKLENKWKDYDRKVDQLIRYGVLIDTFGFDPNQRDRWSIYDRYVVDQIQSEGNYKISYEQLSAYKFDQTLSLELSLSEHFRKDYKKFIYASKSIPKGKYLAQYSIISLDPDTFINKYGQGLTKQAENYQNLAMNSYLNIQIQGCVYFLMFVYEKDGILQRQMIFKANKPEISQIIEKILEDQKMKRVQMEVEGWRRWNDPSCQVSRKKFDVLMNKHF